MRHMSHVTYHMSYVMCNMSHVPCHMSYVTCLMSHIPYHVYNIYFCFSYFAFLDKVVELVGGGSVINGAYHVYLFLLVLHWPYTVYFFFFYFLPNFHKFSIIPQIACAPFLTFSRSGYVVSVSYVVPSSFIINPFVNHRLYNLVFITISMMTWI